ncbi:MAG: MucBP domain-containing protein, partial [Brevundimonas sp.]
MKLTRISAVVGIGALGFGLAGVPTATGAFAAEQGTTQTATKSALLAAAPIGVTARVASVDVPGQSATLTGTGQPGAVLNIHPQGNPVSFITGIPVAGNGTWTATVPGLPVGTNDLLIDQRVPSDPGYLGRAYATVVITAPRVVVHYTDGSGSVASDAVLTGTPGAAYTAAVKDVAGFHVTSLPADAKGSYGKAGSTIDVTIAYAADRGTVVTRFVDAAGNRLADPASDTGRSGSSYVTSAAKIAGWHLTDEPADATGEFPAHDATTTVTYVYARDTGKVVTHFVDAGGDEVAPASEAQTGDSGSSYTTAPIDVPGYHVLVTPSDASGVFPEDSETTDVVYTYALDMGTVVTHLVDVEGRVLADELTQAGRSGTAYETVAPEIPGYVLFITPDDATGSFGADGTTTDVVYVYTATAPVLPPLLPVDPTEPDVDPTTPVVDPIETDVDPTTPAVDPTETDVDPA